MVGGVCVKPWKLTISKRPPLPHFILSLLKKTTMVPIEAQCILIVFNVNVSRTATVFSEDCFIIIIFFKQLYRRWVSTCIHNADVCLQSSMTLA